MFKQMTVGIVALGLVVVLTGCGSSAAGAQTAAGSGHGQGGETVVTLKNTKYDKPKLEIKAGTTVRWDNKDVVDHSVWEGVPDSGKHLIKSDDLSSGQDFKYTFDKPGTYDIFCNTGAHYLIGMKMQVVVN